MVAGRPADGPRARLPPRAVDEAGVVHVERPRVAMRAALPRPPQEEVEGAALLPDAPRRVVPLRAALPLAAVAVAGAA